MNKSVLFFIPFFVLITNITWAQNASQEEVNTSGLYGGVSLLGTSWTMPDLYDEAEAGGGLGLKLGYNINTNIGLFVSADGSSIEPDQGSNYVLAHFDIGAEGRLGDPSSKFRPFLRASLLGMSAQTDDTSGDIEINGAGLGLGAGLYYFTTSNLAFQLSYTHGWVNINEVKVGSSSVEVDEDAQTGRLALGLSYHF